MSFLLRLLGRSPPDPRPPYDFSRNPYKAKREWPPNFNKLSHKQQFRFEKTYRRRAAIRYERPTWNKWTKIAQWTCIVGIVVYAVLFMDDLKGPPGEDGLPQEPFTEIRQWYRETMASMWSQNKTGEAVEAAQKRVKEEQPNQSQKGQTT